VPSTTLIRVTFASRESEFLWLHSVDPYGAATFGVGPGEPTTPRTAGTDPLLRGCGQIIAVFKLLLKFEEHVILSAIKDGQFCVSMASAEQLQTLIALRMLEWDPRGNPIVTDLGEAALARMNCRLH
jgi:hypothetical protein